MKIQKIASRGTVAIKEVEINITSPITLICGSNRAGKTSLCHGIRHAFTGENPLVQLKKNYGHLVNREEVSRVGYTYIDYDDGQKACITLPKGAHELSGHLPHALPYVLNPPLFGRITPDERRRFLFDLGNMRSDGAEVKGKLLERCCDPDKVEMVMPFLRSSFDNAQKHALEKVKDAKAAWKATTGETYGSIKAEDWKAAVPEVDEDKKREFEANLEFAEKELEQVNRKLGAAQAEATGSKARNIEIVRLRETAEKIDRIRTKLDTDREQVSTWTARVEDTRRLAMGSKPGAVSCACPSCGTELIFDGKKLTELCGDLHGDEDSSIKLPEYEATLKMLKNAVANGERDIATAAAAREQLGMLERKDNTATADDVDALSKRVSVLKENRRQFAENLEIVNKNIRLAGESVTKTKKAAEYHAELRAWDLIASALSPEGIPNEMLSDALNPINERIAASIKTLNDFSRGFPTEIIIRDDMTIEEDDNLYNLSSKSTKLLIDSIIAESISHVSGIKFLVIDEVDLLDIPSRSAFLHWLCSLVEIGDLDSAIIFATLKKIPAGLPDAIKSYWLQDGVITEEK